MNDYGLMSLSFTCLLATWYTLLLDSPIIASVLMTTALNLELSLCLPFVPVFIVYSISNIIEMSPSAQIVKQIDYIVWRVMFLCLNIAIFNAIIWWPYITTANENKEETSEQSGPMFDFNPAKKLLFEHLLPLYETYTPLSIPLYI